MNIVIKKDNFKEGLIEAIKVAGQMIIDNAEDIAGKTEYMSNLNILVDFDPEMQSIPELTITRSHLPSRENLEHIFDTFKGKKANSDKTGEWYFTYDAFSNMTYVMCSECRTKNKYAGHITHETFDKFECPDCGAKMESLKFK